MLKRSSGGFPRVNLARILFWIRTLAASDLYLGLRDRISMASFCTVDDSSAINNSCLLYFVAKIDSNSR